MNRGPILSGLALIVITVAVISIFTYRVPGTSHELGQKLVVAAEREQWWRAWFLLRSGADPNLSTITQDQAEALESSYHWLGGALWYSGHPANTERGTPLQLAMQQGNAGAVKMLLAYHAEVSGRDVYLCQQSGNHEIIQLIEDAGNVPASRRNITPIPFAFGGQSDREFPIPGTKRAVPMRHFLWLSSNELLLLHKYPWRFSVLNINSETETELPELSEKWAGQDLLDPDMLAISPNGQWLFGYGGTPDHPTWLATEIHGNGKQEWDRNATPDPAMRAATHGESNPMIAWRDNSSWVEIPVCPPRSSVVRQRSLGSPDVHELPLDRTKYSFVLGYPYVLFNFPNPDLGLICGQTSGNQNYSVCFMAKVIPGPDAWHMDNGGELRIPLEKCPGWFQRCVPSPDGKRLAWLHDFSSSEVVNIMLSDPDGTHFRTIYEKIGRPQQWEENRREAPWFRSLEWTPDGNRLIFWRGGNGENGLGYLCVSADE